MSKPKKPPTGAFGPPPKTPPAVTRATAAKVGKMAAQTPNPLGAPAPAKGRRKR